MPTAKRRRRSPKIQTCVSRDLELRLQAVATRARRSVSQTVAMLVEAALEAGLDRTLPT